MRNLFARRRADHDISLDDMSVVPFVGYHPYDYPDPTDFASFEAELIERLNRIIDSGAVDEGNAHALDRAIDHERLRARSALVRHRTYHRVQLRALLGKRIGDLNSLTQIHARLTQRLDDIESRMLIDRANWDAHRRPPQDVDIYSMAYSQPPRAFAASDDRRSTATRE